MDRSFNGSTSELSDDQQDPESQQAGIHEAAQRDNFTDSTNGSADAEMRGEDGFADIHRAVMDGNEVKLNSILADHIDTLDVTDHSGATALHMAAQLGKDRMAKILIEAGADLNMSDTDGTSPLYMAVIQEDEVIVKDLIDAGADLHIADKNGATALHMSSENSDLIVAQLLLKAGADCDRRNLHGWTPLHDAVQGGNEDIVRLLMKAGATVDTKDEDGWTPLYLAAQHEQIDIMKILLDEGNADINTLDKDGNTPICVAVSYDHLEVLDFLLKNGADPTISNNNGEGPWELAVSEKTKKMLLDFDPSLAGETFKLGGRRKSLGEISLLSPSPKAKQNVNSTTPDPETQSPFPAVSDPGDEEKVFGWTPADEEFSEDHQDSDDDTEVLSTTDRLLSARKSWEKKQDDSWTFEDDSPDEKPNLDEGNSEDYTVGVRDILEMMWDEKIIPMVSALEEQINKNAIEVEEKLLALRGTFEEFEKTKNNVNNEITKNVNNLKNEQDKGDKGLIMENARDDILVELELFITSVFLLLIIKTTLQFLEV